MGKQPTLMMIALSFFLMFGPSVTNAQLADNEVDADIPFKFTVGDTSLPAGKYIISTPDSNDRKLLEIRGADDQIAVMFFTSAVQAPSRTGRTELVFNRCGSGEFVSQIWVEGSEFGNQLEVSRMQAKLEKSGLKTDAHSVDAHSRKARHMKL
jgi:hypothetical protein